MGFVSSEVSQVSVVVAVHQISNLEEWKEEMEAFTDDNLDVTSVEEAFGAFELVKFGVLADGPF